MTNKKFLFIGMAVLLSASLFFLGCPTEEEEEETPPPAKTVEAALPASGASFQVVEVGTDDTAKLKVGTDEKWYPLGADAVSLAIRAIWDPNKPSAVADSMTLDGTESPKTAVAYTEALSAEVLALFTVTVGNPSANPAVPHKIEITGTALPSAATYSATATNLIVIDVGIPGSDNSGLPVFSIPNQGLGANATTTYAHIRLRVNNGASLVILADNSGYIGTEGGQTYGAGNPCADGYFNGGCVEVMAGGKLRDGAYEGFPLGANAIILNRFGSYLSVGPEPDSADATTTVNSTNDSYAAYYEGYLVGPITSTEADKPRIEWDATAQNGNSAASYLEVRPGAIATDAKLTVRKDVGLIYSVWFVDNAHITIDGTGATQQSPIHLAANESTGGTDFNFYAPTSQSTKVLITIKQYNWLDKRFLIATAANFDQSNHLISPSNSTDITISAPTAGNSVDYVDNSTGISGALVTPPAS
jgi:hypothetical protein